MNAAIKLLSQIFDKNNLKAMEKVDKKLKIAHDFKNLKTGINVKTR